MKKVLIVIKWLAVEIMLLCAFIVWIAQLPEMVNKELWVSMMLLSSAVFVLTAMILEIEFQGEKTK